jgi:hypothetical protein
MKISKKTLIISASTFFVIAILGGLVLATNNFDLDFEDSKDSNASSLVENADTDSSEDTNETPDVTSDSSEEAQKMIETQSSVADVMQK